MKTVIKKAIVEVGTLVVAAMIIILLLRTLGGQKAAPRSPYNDSQKSELAVGAKVNIKGVSFQGKPLSLILVSSPHCAYCVASENFHKRLAVATANNRVAFYAIVPNRQEATGYIQTISLEQNHVKEWDDLDGTVRGTPTLLAVNNEGMVVRTWVGRVPPDVESQILDVAASPGRLTKPQAGVEKQPSEFTLPQLQQALKRRQVQVIDVRERSDTFGMMNEAHLIPLRELIYRAPVEEDTALLQVVDCRNLSDQLCNDAADQLQSIGMKVRTVGRGDFYQTCQVQRAEYTR